MNYFNLGINLLNPGNDHQQLPYNNIDSVLNVIQHEHVRSYLLTFKISHHNINDSIGSKFWI